MCCEFGDSVGEIQIAAIKLWIQSRVHDFDKQI